MMQSKTKFLILKPSSLGDIIHGLQVAESIRLQIPNAHITWVASDIFQEWVASCTTVDHVIPFYRTGGISKFLKLIQYIRTERYDYVLDFQGLFRTGLMTWGAHGTHKIGRGDAREGARWFYNKMTAARLSTPMHAIDRLLQFMPFLNLEPKLKGYLTFKSTTTVTSGIPGRAILLFPNSRRPEKEWPYFSELTEYILDCTTQTTVVWLGQTAPKINPRWPTARFINLIGKTSLLDLAPIIQKASHVIANDSGPMHLSVAQNISVTALFGPTDPICYGPYTMNALCGTTHVLQAPDLELSKLSVETVGQHLKKIKLI